jgi:hypothetical protein
MPIGMLGDQAPDKLDVLRRNGAALNNCALFHGA